MRALRLLLVLAILLIAVPGYAGVSDPNEIVENSHVDQQPIRSSNAWQQVTKSVSNTVTNTVGTTVNKVKGWLNKGLETIIGNQKQSVAKKVAGPQPTPAITRQEQVKNLTETLAKPMPQQEVKSEDLAEARMRLKNEGAAKIVVPGRKAQGDLRLSKVGVPIFPMEHKSIVKLPNGKTKVVLGPLKRIPRLDIGLEPTLSKSDYLGKTFEPTLIDVQTMAALPSPELVQDSVVKAQTSKPVVLVEMAKDLDKKGFGIDKIVTKEAILKALPKISVLSKQSEKPVQPLSEAQLKMLSALILYSKGDRCHVLLGLFDELSKNQSLADEANFHLGQCAYRMNMTSLGFDRLSGLIQAENKDFTAEALRTLIKGLPMEFEQKFSKLIRNLKNKKLIPDNIKDEIHYLTAKGAFKEGIYQEARQYAERIPESSARYGNAQYIIGVSLFSVGQINKGAAQLEALRSWMSDKKISDKNLNSLTAINLARIKFTQGNYKEALPLYMAIDKDHPVWVQGLMEQGWVQLAQNDFSGAIGNMYSLHSPYFKAVYKPESFVVRTIGYLNICQYGDAYRTLSWLEREYRPWMEQINQYSTSKKLASDYYETIIRYLKGKSSDDVDGLPYQVIREMARQKEFLNAQTALNAKAEEIGRYEGIDKLIQQEKVALKNREIKAAQRFKEIKAKLAAAAKDKSIKVEGENLKQQMKLERELVIGLRYQAEILESSRKSYLSLHPQIMAKIERDRYQLREIAGRDLVQTLIRLRSEMNTVLANNEFLRYEVFAGSGENIRYQVAGGEVAEANRIPASVKPTKLMNWSFDGEYWEDEIGSYRSSLRNNCPQTGKMDEYFKADDHAAHAKGQAAIEKGAGQ